MVDIFDPISLKKIYIPLETSHKGDNGKVLIIGGSKLFHAASLWSLEIASKIVDMVFYSSVPENNVIVQEIKKEWRNGIVVPREKLADYIEEADAVLIGPGLPRREGQEAGDDDTKLLTESLLKKYPHKRWVIDGGSLQVMDPDLIPKNAILTPHHKEFETIKSKIKNQKLKMKIESERIEDQVKDVAQEYNCVFLLKGEEDIVCSPTQCIKISGGNAGMTKGGTGDVLSGLTVSLYAQNADPLLVAEGSSYINKQAGDRLFARVGVYYNASDLLDEIPLVMKQLLH